MRSMTSSAEWPLRANTTCTPSTVCCELLLAVEWGASKTTGTPAHPTIPKTERRSSSLSRAASSEASPSSRLSCGQAWITLYPSTITRSISELVEAHVRLAEEDQARVDARKSGDVENQLKEGRAERRNEPERGEHRDDPQLSVLDRQALKR